MYLHIKLFNLFSFYFRVVESFFKKKFFIHKQQHLAILTNFNKHHTNGCVFHELKFNKNTTIKTCDLQIDIVDISIYKKQI